MNTPWDCYFLEGGIDQAWTNFNDLFLTVADQCIPSFVLKRRTKSWFSDEVTTLIRSKRRAYPLAKR